MDLTGSFYCDFDLFGGVWSFLSLKLLKKYPRQTHIAYIDIKVWQARNHNAALINVIIIKMSQRFLQITLSMHK